MNTVQIIKETFPQANDNEIHDLGDIAIIKGYENVKTPEKYLEKYLDNQVNRNEATYLKNGIMQCSPERNRSFTDLYAIVRAKFPRLKIDRFAYILLKYQLKPGKKMHVSYCNGVHKVVIKSHPLYEGLLDKNWDLVNDEFVKITSGNHISDCDGYRKNDPQKLNGDGVTIKKITELANSYLLQLKNK